MRVMVAMSGGVDSSVAAARMVDAGNEVIGVHLTLAGNAETCRAGARGGSPDDSDDARRVADMLGIPFYAWDLSDMFQADVVDYFVAEYAAGRTPNPCLRCNKRIKFAAVLERGLALGFDAVATGHYARVRRIGGRVELLRSADAAKDQSYVLGVLSQEQLRHSLFPLGDAVSKSDVRAEAAARGLAVAEKPDSTDICFIPDGDTAGFLRERLGVRMGEIVDENGTVLGTHEGAYRFTVGQRHGLRLNRPAADGRPRYVVRVDAAANRVVVGPKEALEVVGMEGSRLTWTGDVDPGPWHGLAQWRAHSQPVPATFRTVGDRLQVALDAPAYGVAPGQTVVCYAADRVVGSATIVQTHKEVAGDGSSGPETGDGSSGPAAQRND